ncbi:MAG: DCC1-like thiol-disulfide oxidoreductase family protein [Actinomycetota bacterium]
MGTTGLLIYDGDCGFCTSTAQWYGRRAGPAASIEMWQALDLDAFGLTADDTSTAVWFRDADGELTSGADACAAAMQAVPSAWRVTGHVLALPGVIHLARLIYPFIAKHRHRLPGGTPACKL